MPYLNEMRKAEKLEDGDLRLEPSYGGIRYHAPRLDFILINHNIPITITLTVRMAVATSPNERHGTTLEQQPRWN
jgi:hypothetical protein